MCVTSYGPQTSPNIVNANELVCTRAGQEALNLHTGTFRFSNVDSAENVDTTCLTQANHATVK